MRKPGKGLFCSKPFEWFEVTQLNGRGGVYLCCPSWLNTTLGNIRYQSVGKLWAGPRAQEIRRSILDGSFRFCDTQLCAYFRTRTGPVQFIRDVSDPILIDIIRNSRTALPHGPSKIICTYDQSCNLSCPTCRERVIVEQEGEHEILEIQKRLDAEALPKAELLYISGSGDPFGSPYFRRWLLSMKRADMPNLKEICLHTNGLLWTPEMWGTLPEDIRPLVRSAEISIDAASPGVYALNRRGGDFGRLMENLAFVGRLREDGPLRYVKISMVVQANNVADMPEFVRLGRRFGFDCVYFGRLLDWGTFSKSEFSSRAVHLRGHPGHADLVRTLGMPLFRDPIVHLGNLDTFRGRSLY